MPHGLSDLVGVEVSGIALRADSEQLLIGGWLLEAYGDCCSSSWFEHLDGAAALLGSTILAVEEVQGPDGTPDHEDDVLQTYFLKFTTTKGRATLEMRNESNGYYGGSFDVMPFDQVTYDRSVANNAAANALHPVLTDF